uniref:PTS sugar transporter subunit IIA n=1 Tax=Escherichia marmotae TaxID=1499973 RepID=UPI001E48C25C|nr:PTS sugar transporter subunit IIA [Escherichia marmotae]
MNQFDIIILTHGEGGNYLLSSSEMIVGKTKNSTSLSLQPGMSPETLMLQVKAVLRPGIDTLIFTDIYGGTPSNIALLLSKDFPIRCISGVNLAMLIEANMLQDSDEILTFEEYVQHVHDAGKEMVQTYYFNKG